jgi:hypothetical protein
LIIYDPANPLSDFRAFLFMVWKHLKLPDPTVRQYALARFLQAPGNPRKVILAFRGVGKSWVLAAFVCFLLYHNPALNIMVVSASKGRADNFTTFVLRLITELPILQHLYPHEGQRCSKMMFDVGPAPASQSPSVYSVGITGQLAGSRADVVIADDVEIPNNSATLMMREKLSESVKEFDAVLKPGGHVIYLGTPQTEDSVYKHLEGRGYELRIWPARFPNDSERADYGPRLAPDVGDELDRDKDLVGHTTEPSRFTDADLLERELSYGRAGFALQFMLRTNLADLEKYPLRQSDLMFMPLDAGVGPEKPIWSNLPENLLNDASLYPNVGIGKDRLYRPVLLATPGSSHPRYAPYTGCVMAIDPSGRGKDETGYAIVATLHGNLFLLDAGGFNDGFSPETLKSLALLAKRFNVNQIVVEANYGGGMYTELLKPVISAIHPCGIEEVIHSTQKERRIADTLEPVMNQHRLIVNAELLKKDYDSTLHLPTDGNAQSRYRLFYQMTRLTRDKGSLGADDRLDALAMAVGYWTEAMAQDVDQAVKTAREALLDRELERFMEHSIGYKSSNGGWMPHR